MKTIVYDHQTFALQQFGGISRYFCELASRVNRTDEFRSLVIAPLHINDHLLECDTPSSGVHMRMRGPRLSRLYGAFNRLTSPALMRAARPSLLHRTYYASQAARPSLPNVVTVFDMIHELFADHFAPADTTSLAKRRCVEQADRVLCISQNTAADLMRLFDVPREKISVTYLGFSDAFSATPGEPEAPPHPRPYLLYVGHRAAYKNFESAFNAYASSPALRQEFDFVTFGGFPFNNEEESLIHSSRLRPGSVTRLSGSDRDLARAYRHARAFVYPSLYEGFGIPPLEAMSSRCAVACSNVSSIPEVVGNAAALFDPSDVNAIRLAVERVCFDEAYHAQLVDAGLRQARQFSWERCAQETADAYRITLGL